MVPGDAVFPALSFLMRYSSTQAVASGGYNLLVQRQQQVFAVKKFIKQRIELSGMVASMEWASTVSLCRKVRSRHSAECDFPGSLRPPEHNRVGVLPLSGCVGRPIIFSSSGLSGVLNCAPSMAKSCRRASHPSGNVPRPCLCGLAEDHSTGAAPTR